MGMLLKQLSKKFKFRFKKEELSSSFLWLLIFFSSCIQENGSVNYQKNVFWNLEEFSKNVQDGDIILKMGYGPVSRIISKQLNEKQELSHCAIVYKKDSSEFIIHSVSREISENDGVQKASFDDFYKDIKPNSLFVLRHKSNQQERSKISNFGFIYLKKLTPFDDDFNNGDSSKLYCSELVSLALFNSYKKNYFKTKRIGVANVYTFSSILESSDFVIVNSQN